MVFNWRLLLKRRCFLENVHHLKLILWGNIRDVEVGPTWCFGVNLC